ncbi:hypothetical protein [Brevibacterium salitolerans]|uniref:hypothetical protein n=1 Tax=Brevibacterium salitolerans TaxID=1403566 RepID=UPI0031E3BF12
MPAPLLRTQTRRTRLVQAPVLLHAGNLAEYGLPPYQLSNARGLEAVIRGVRRHPERTQTLHVPSWADERWLSVRERAEALQLRMPEAVVSHASAAELRGWVLPRRFTAEPLLHVTSPVSHVRREGCIGHRPKETETCTEWGVSLVEAPEALRQMCALLTDEELLTLLEGLCGPWHGAAVSTVAELEAAAAEWSRFPGCRRLSRALRRARDGVASPQETRLRLEIVAAGLPEPEVNAEVRANGMAYHPDLSYRRAQIALEYEGDHHRTDPQQWEHDIRREADFRAAGWEYLRVTRRTHRSALFADLRSMLHRRSPMSHFTSKNRGKSDVK